MRKGMRGSETEAAKDKKLRQRRDREKRQQRMKHAIGPASSRQVVRAKQRIKSKKKIKPNPRSRNT